MTTRIDARFAKCRAEGRAALVTFVMCGDPDLATSLDLLRALPKAGADVIEVGMPFTDPMADGPSIQAAGPCQVSAPETASAGMSHTVRNFSAISIAVARPVPRPTTNTLRASTRVSMKACQSA